MDMTHPDIIAAEKTGYPYGQVTKTAGNCGACGSEMYDYQATECGNWACSTCGIEKIHTDCVRKCLKCEHLGCKACLVKDDETGEYFCPECLKR